MGAGGGTEPLPAPEPPHFNHCVTAASIIDCLGLQGIGKRKARSGVYCVRKMKQ